MRIWKLFDLSGKVAIVTGGGSGLGRQIADALADSGANVVLCARKVDRCVKAAAELSSAYGVRSLGLACDVREPKAIVSVVEQVVAELGRIDILVNNAGTTWGAWPEDTPLEAWQKVISVNLTGAFLFIQAAGRVMIEQGEGGRIINVASVAAFRGSKPEVMNAIPYNVSKGGLVAMTTDLATKWARYGITVNAIAPGWFPSDLSAKVLDDAGDLLLDRIPLGRFGSSDDLKGVVVLLASAASGYITGQTIAIDGGMLAT